MIPIYKPYINKYKKSALDSIDSEWISNHGIYIPLASEKLATLLGVKYCILMNNGTSATQCLFEALRYTYTHIEKIYVPNNTFVAPLNCGLKCYDISIFEVMALNENTMNIDTSEEYIMSLDKNSAMVVVHNLGNVVNVPRLKRLRPDMIFVEDNCEGLFGTYEGMYSGTASLCSSVSFYGNKTLTTGEGGAFLTNDKDVYDYIKTMYSHGMSEERYIHNVLGTNYRMTNVQAGFLYDQLNDIEHILSLKRKIFERYDVILEKEFKSGSLKKLFDEKDTTNSKWMYCVIMTKKKYKPLEHYMNERNIQIRPFFYDVHSHDHLQGLHKHKEQQFTNEITDHGIMLPSYPELTYDQQKYIVLTLIEFLQI